MKRKGWTIAFCCIVALAGVSWALAWKYGSSEQPFLVVVAAHEVFANHKVGSHDLSFALRRLRPPMGAVESPEQAIGSCTLVEIGENEPIAWGQVMPTGTGDGTCASAAAALITLDTILRIPTESASGITNPTPQGKANVPTAGSAFPRWQSFDAFSKDADELSPAKRAALVEFRSEFMKEFAKRLADNAADRVFSRDPSGKDTVKAPLPPVPQPDSPAPAPGQLVIVTLFDYGKAVLSASEHESLVRYSKDLLQYADCQIMVFGYADRTGTQRDNLWLSWLRGSAVASVMISNGVDRRLITVVPRGYEEPSIDAISGIPVALNRRAETYVGCSRRDVAATGNTTR